MPTRRKAAIGGAKRRTHAWNPRACDERPSPPDVPGEFDDGVGPAKDFAARQGYPHFIEQTVFSPMEQLGARILQPHKSKTARFENWSDAPNPS